MSLSHALAVHERCVMVCECTYFLIFCDESCCNTSSTASTAVAASTAPRTKLDATTSLLISSLLELRNQHDLGPCSMKPDTHTAPSAECQMDIAQAAVVTVQDPVQERPDETANSHPRRVKRKVVQTAEDARLALYLQQQISKSGPKRRRLTINLGKRARCHG